MRAVAQVEDDHVVRLRALEGQTAPEVLGEQLRVLVRRDGRAQHHMADVLLDAGQDLGDKLQAITVWAQGWFRDPPAPAGSNLSDGLVFQVGP